MLMKLIIAGVLALVELVELLGLVFTKVMLGKDIQINFQQVVDLGWTMMMARKPHQRIEFLFV
ncbi:MAG TPA: hypothetical protein DD856_11460 [Sulfobacillus sp.]|nr:hypothetical protein [Sulfobacillus sp.]